MKRLVALLATVGGCDAFFGIKTSLLRDSGDSDGLDAPYLSMTLTRQVLEDPSGLVDYPAATGATVQVGAIDPAAGALHALAVRDDGSFLVPPELATADYRLVYQVDSDVPTEIHSPPNGAHFVAPELGRVARDPPPVFALLEWNPAGKVGDYVNPRVFTTGMWSSYDFASAEGGPGRDFGYQQYARSLSGPLGSLAGSSGDLEVLVDASFVGGTPVLGDASGFAVMSVDHLNADTGGPATAASTWKTSPIASVAWTGPTSGPNGPVSRLTAALGCNYTPATFRSVTWGGVVPTDRMPNFIEPNPGGLAVPAMFGLSTTTATPHRFANPFNGVDAPLLPVAAMVEDSTTWMVGGVALTAGFQHVAAAGTTTLDEHVGIAYKPGGELTLAPSGDPSHASVLASNDTLACNGRTVTLGGARLAELTFDTDRAVDDCIVTLYQLETSSLTPIRHFLLLHPPTVGTPFAFDASLFDAVHSYVFGIVCRSGFANVSTTADYTAVAAPYSFATSTLYSLTFQVVP